MKYRILLFLIISINYGCTEIKIEEKYNKTKTNVIENEILDSTNFNYVQFFHDYEISVKENIDFNVLVDTFFYLPEKLKEDSQLESYLLNQLKYKTHLNLLEKPNDIIYVWGEDMLETEFSVYYTNVCDENLVIYSISHEKLFLPVCFYEEKIYSLAPGFDKKTNKVTYF